MIFKRPTELINSNIFLSIDDILHHTTVYLKLEGLSVTGSIKIKSAIRMLARLELENRLRPGMRVIESSSGNLGIALSMACASKGYEFICVSDPNISPQSSKIIQAYGSKLLIVENRDANGGFLGSRISLIRRMMAVDPSLVWINQYENTSNVEAHYLTTGPEILAEFPNPDFVFIGAGTTGTLGGASRYIKEHSPATKIVAVDTVGSVTFGGPAGKRHIPGLGTSQAPGIRHLSVFDELVMIEELQTVEMCHRMARRGLLLGGSSGTVLSAVVQFCDRIPRGASVIVVAPDMGDAYVDTIYNNDWLHSRYGWQPDSPIRTPAVQDCPLETRAEIEH